MGVNSAGVCGAAGWLRGGRSVASPAAGVLAGLHERGACNAALPVCVHPAAAAATSAAQVNPETRPKPPSGKGR